MIHLIKDDYKTPIVFHAKSNGRTIPLVGSEVVFDFISKTNNRRVGGGKCEMVDSAAGIAKYTFKGSELAHEGEYQGKLKIDLTQGARREALALEFKIVSLEPAAPVVAPAAPVVVAQPEKVADNTGAMPAVAVAPATS